MNNSKMNKVEEYLKAFGYQDKIIEFKNEIATVAQAALEIGCTEAEIAKSLSFKIDEETILIVMAGDVKIDNAKYRETFKEKARMLDLSEVEERTGHPVGGVCPFALNENVKVYLDESLKRFEIVYPAAGSRNNCIQLTVSELEKIVRPVAWVDVTKRKE